jgi:hypothetical protein
MATADQITLTRLLVSEPVTSITYTDVVLSARIDAADDDLNVVARDIWLEKAASYVALTDISEGGSSRANGALHEKALKMAAWYSDAVNADASAAARGVIVSRLTR